VTSQAIQSPIRQKNNDVMIQMGGHELKVSMCCGQQLTQKLEITLEASELEPITQQLTQN
jgi:hypothetical protein